MIKNKLLLVVALLSLCISDGYAVENVAVAKIKGEMLIIFNHPQPDMRDISDALKMPYIAKIEVIDVTPLKDIEGFVISNLKGEILLIYKMTIKNQTDIKNMPARFKFIGKLYYLPVQVSNFLGTSTLEIEKITEVINMHKIDKATLNAKWKDFSGNDSKKALEALEFLDSNVETGMGEKEVLSLFPKGTFVKEPLSGEKDGFYLRMNGDLQRQILAPNSFGRYNYGIRFDKNGVVWGQGHIMLHGDV